MNVLGKVDPLLYNRAGDEVTLTPAGLARCFQVANGLKLDEEELFTLNLICRSATPVEVDGASVVSLASKGLIKHHSRGHGYAHTAAGYEAVLATTSEAARLIERVRHETDAVQVQCSVCGALTEEGNAGMCERCYSEANWQQEGLP